MDRQTQTVILLGISALVIEHQLRAKKIPPGWYEHLEAKKKAVKKAPVPKPAPPPPEEVEDEDDRFTLIIEEEEDESSSRRAGLDAILG